MTDLNLEELKQIAQNATPGPWRTFAHNTRESACVETAFVWEGTDDSESVTDWCEHYNAAHIAAFDPPTVLALIARIDNLEATIQRVRDVHKPVTHHLLAKYCQCGQTIPCRTIQALEGDQK